MTLKTNGSLLRWLLGTGTAGFGVVIGLGLLEAVRAKPEMALRLLESWGPLFGVIVMGAVVFDRRFGQFIRTQQETAVALTGVSEAVRQIADKDDQRAREQDLRLSYLASNSDAVLKEIREVKKRLPAQGGPT